MRTTTTPPGGNDDLVAVVERLSTKLDSGFEWLGRHVVGRELATERGLRRSAEANAQLLQRAVERLESTCEQLSERLDLSHASNRKLKRAVMRRSRQVALLTTVALGELVIALVAEVHLARTYAFWILVGTMLPAVVMFVTWIARLTADSDDDILRD